MIIVKLIPKQLLTMPNSDNVLYCAPALKRQDQGLGTRAYGLDPRVRGLRSAPWLEAVRPETWRLRLGGSGFGTGRRAQGLLAELFACDADVSANQSSMPASIATF